MSKLIRGEFIFLVLLSCATALHSQVSGGTITGTITDVSGSVLPQAKVNVTNRDTGVIWSTITNSEGYYAAPNLGPGRYQVQAASPGFGSRAANITVTVGDDLKLDLSLAPGTVD